MATTGHITWPTPEEAIEMEAKRHNHITHIRDGVWDEATKGSLKPRPVHKSVLDAIAEALTADNARRYKHDEYFAIHD